MPDDRYEDFEETTKVLSQATGQDDDVRLLCQDVLRMFDDAKGNRGAFVSRLEEAASYCGWDPEETYEAY